METEPKQEVETMEDVRDASESVVDDAMSKAYDEEQETPESSSDSEETTTEETEVTEDAGADQPKKASPEETKVDEEEVPKGFADHPKWQKLLQERNEAREQAGTSTIPQDVQTKLAEFERITSSPAYVRASMEAQGYKPEVIDTKLRDLGHDIPVPTQDDVKLVLDKLGIKMDNLDEQGKQYINTNVADMAKVADILIQDRLAKALSMQIEPIQEQLAQMTQSQSGNKVLGEMQAAVKTEGILDFKTDIEPVLAKYLDSNPEATQLDVFNHFKEVNHSLSIERLKTHGRREERDAKKQNLRGNKPGATITPGKLPDLTGDVNNDLDNALDALGINN